MVFLVHWCLKCENVVKLKSLGIGLVCPIWQNSGNLVDFLGSAGLDLVWVWAEVSVWARFLDLVVFWEP